jgi:two-component system CheB/CheR fusion protein
MVAERTQWLNETMNELKASNQNLEEYAYIASHDLQEPLRKIQTLAGLLQRNAAESLGEETKSLLTRISDSSLRMSSLVAELLNFSKVKVTTEGFVDTDLKDIVEKTIVEFGPEISEKKATIHVGKLPVIKADPSGMLQLFHNLLSNALKFSKKDHAPEIRIDARFMDAKDLEQFPVLRKDGHYTSITYSDNGIGFKQEYAEQIFVIFRGLNVRGAYNGTGMGLTICRKIVMNHRGIILVQSQEGIGTDFNIILPVEALQMPGKKLQAALV